MHLSQMLETGVDVALRNRAENIISKHYEWYAEAILISKQKCRGLGPSVEPGLTRR